MKGALLVLLACAWAPLASGSIATNVTTIIAKETAGLSTGCPLGRKGTTTTILPNGDLLLFGGKTQIAGGPNEHAYTAFTKAGAKLNALKLSAATNASEDKALEAAKRAHVKAHDDYVNYTRAHVHDLPEKWDGSPAQVINDLWKVNLDGGHAEWSEVLPWRPGHSSDKAPETLWKTDSVRLGDDMLMYGGCPCLDRGCNFSDSLWVLGSDADSARVLEQEAPTRAVRGVSMATLPESGAIIAVGGKVDATHCSSDVFRMDAPDSKHHKARGWEQLQAYPGACRWGFSLDVVRKEGREMLVLFGGRTENYTDTDYATNHDYFNDVMLYDIHTQNWTVMKHSKPWPGPRNHLGTAVIDNMLYVFGGRTSVSAYGAPSGELWRYNPEQNTWRLLDQGKHKPMARFGHEAGAWKEQLVVFGGESITVQHKTEHSVHATQTLLNDLWAFDTKRSVWTNLQPKCTGPATTQMEAVLPRTTQQASSDSSGRHSMLLAGAVVGLAVLAVGAVYGAMNAQRLRARFHYEQIATANEGAHTEV